MQDGAPQSRWVWAQSPEWPLQPPSLDTSRGSNNLIRDIQQTFLRPQVCLMQEFSPSLSFVFITAHQQIIANQPDQPPHLSEHRNWSSLSIVSHTVDKLMFSCKTSLSCLVSHSWLVSLPYPTCLHNIFFKYNNHTTVAYAIVWNLVLKAFCFVLAILRIPFYTRISYHLIGLTKHEIFVSTKLHFPQPYIELQL